MLEVVVLAAGAGERMRSRLPKVLHPLAGRPLLGHVLDAAAALEPSRIHVVVGDGGAEIRARFAAERSLDWVRQVPPRGTGDAVAKAMRQILHQSVVLVVLGDVPLVRTETLAACVAEAERGAVALVTAVVPTPEGLGRIVRDAEGRVASIVEERDATPEQLAIAEINTGVLAAPAGVLGALLPRVRADNDQGEYYLTDVVALASEAGFEVAASQVAEPLEVLGVNDRSQLARLERHCQRRAAEELMASGVTVLDPDRLDVRGRLVAGEDCTIDVGVVFEGEVELGRGVQIGAGCVIRNSKLGDGVAVAPMSCLDGASVAEGCRVGPFARLRPGTELGAEVRIGNFVETKKARIGAGTKASHLAYLGDATVGERCNVGAGAITCNYDGADKHETRLGDRVFVGTNATLVAPVEVDDEAYVGAGSTVTKNVGRKDLAIGRSRQRNIQGWQPPAARARKETEADPADAAD